MSNNTHSDKKRKGADGGAVPDKVESGGGSSLQAVVVPPRDHSNLTPIQRLLRIELLKDDSDAVKEALTQLADLCENKTADAVGSNRAAVDTAAGGAVLIAVAMDKWNAVPAIQAEGCRAIQIISAAKDSAFKQFGQETGAIDAVILAMKEHPNDSNVQENACGALSNFARVESNAYYVVNELNGVELIVTAMNKVKDNANLQKWGSSALNNLLDWNGDDFKETIQEAGGRRALFDAIENHEGGFGEIVENLVVEQATRALKKLL